jgi:hypothetical protein
MMNKSGLDTTPLFYNHNIIFISRTTLVCELHIRNGCEINVKIKTKNEIETNIPSLKNKTYSFEIFDS